MNMPQLTPRQRAREIAFQFLYRLDDEALKPSPNTLEKDFKIHAEHFVTPKESYEFAYRLVKEVTYNLEAIDALITKYAENWRIERLGTVDRSFMRMGVAELLYFKDVPAAVTLNEVVELSKYFGEAETPAFLNGILDPISKESEAVEGKIASE